MIFYISETIKSITGAFKALFDYLTKKTDKQIETTVIKDKEKLKRAADITEEVFWNIREYMATDSQFTMWVARLFFETANEEEKRFFRRFYKSKLRLKKKIEKLQKEFEKNN